MRFMPKMHFTKTHLRNYADLGQDDDSCVLGHLHFKAQLLGWRKSIMATALARLSPPYQA